MKPVLLIGALLLAAPAALAQTQAGAPAASTESVTVTALRERQMQAFVESRAAPSLRLGKLERWERGVCPVAAGLKPVLLEFIVQRVKDIAAKVGAPVNDSANCRYNVQIVFSSAPQKVLDYIRKDREGYLGYHETGAQADALARLTHPIQAWYTTATIDLRGNVHPDAPRKDAPQCLDVPECRIMLDAEQYAVTGTRLGDGLRSGLINVIVIADRDKLVNHEIGALADTIAFLVLAQPKSLDDCQALPSILNLLAPGCTATAREISAVDLAYLRGLYHMRADMMLAGQKSQILYHMKQALGH